MNSKLSLWLGFAMLLVLSSCGGGVGSGGTGHTAGGVGSGGTGISIGPISGFGSIFVNGVEYDTNTATLTLADATSLQLGMTVEVNGSSSADFLTGTATQVVSAADLRGTVTAINTAAGTLDVLGTTISTDPATAWDGVAGLVSLSVGDELQIYGLLDAPGNLRATRIEKHSSPSTTVVSGSVANLNTASNTFDLGNLTVNYASSGFGSGLSANQLIQGLKVRVRSTGAPVAGVLTATSMDLWHSTQAVEGEVVSLSGVVTDYTGLNAFKLLGMSVNASTAHITGGLANSIGNGVKVEVNGSIQNGSLTASKLAIKHIPGAGGPASFNLNGTIGNYASSASFRVKGNPVDASGAGVVYSGGSAGNLGNGVKVTIVGSQVVNGALIADTVTFNP